MIDGVAIGSLRGLRVAFLSELADFGMFYERTYQVAYRTALGIVRDAALAADVTQEAYVAAFRRREHFRGEAPGQAWLYRIVVNQALSAVRRRSPVVRDISAMDIGRDDDARSTADQLALVAALDALAPRQRAAVILRYYHDYDYATIARILNTTSTNVGAMLSRALDRLRAELEPSEPLAATGLEW